MIKNWKLLSSDKKDFKCLFLLVELRLHEICTVGFFKIKRNLTINAPLILQVREVIFYAGKTYNGAFRGVFRGSLDFFYL